MSIPQVGCNSQVLALALEANLAHESTKGLKKLKTAMANYSEKLAWIWGWRHVRLGLAPSLARPARLFAGSIRAAPENLPRYLSPSLTLQPCKSKRSLTKLQTSGFD
jgi:hypothetical protein